MNHPRNKRKPDPTVVKCGDEQDAYLAYIAMFRYAFGRMTYMPETIVGIVKRNADSIGLATLHQLDRELTDEAARYERVWKGRETTNYGMDCDRQKWLDFHTWVKEQIVKKTEG